MKFCQNTLLIKVLSTNTNLCTTNEIIIFFYFRKLEIKLYLFPRFLYLILCNKTGKKSLSFCGLVSFCL